MRNLLLISKDFPPLNTIASRRFGELCLYTKEFGYTPWVLTMNCTGPLKIPIPAAQIFRAGAHPRGFQKEPQWYSDRTAFRLASQLGFRALAAEPRFFSWVQSALKLFKKISEETPKMDVVVGTYGPSSSLFLARAFARKMGVPWVADFRDLGAFREDSRNILIKFLDQAWEKRLVKSAAALTTVSPTLQEILGSHYDKPTAVIFNGFDSVLEPSKTPRRDPALVPSKYLHYAGQLYPHQMKSIELLFRVVKPFEELRIFFRLLGPQYLAEQVGALAKAYGLQERVILKPAGHSEELTDEAARATANLVFEDLSREKLWSRGTITGKLLRLLPLRPPVLAIARADSDIRVVLENTKKGEICEDEETLKKLLQEFLERPQNYSGKTDSIKTYSKREQARILCSFLDEVLPKNRQTETKAVAS